MRLPFRNRWGGWLPLSFLGNRSIAPGGTGRFTIPALTFGGALRRKTAKPPCICPAYCTANWNALSLNGAKFMDRPTLLVPRRHVRTR